MTFRKGLREPPGVVPGSRRARHMSQFAPDRSVLRFIRTAGDENANFPLDLFGCPCITDETKQGVHFAGEDAHRSRAGSERLPPFDAFWGSRYAEVCDPDGNVLGFHSPADHARRPPHSNGP